MDNRRNDSWEASTEVYSPGQIEALLDYLNIGIEQQTMTHFLTYCPFHGNRDTPAFAVDKNLGLWTCFNPSCGEAGNLRQLIERRTRLNFFEITRLILEHQDSNRKPLHERLAEIRETVPEFIEFPQGPLDRMYDDFWKNDKAQKYMAGRHFEERTLRHFRIGYSPYKVVKQVPKPEMVIVPMHDPDGMPIGLIGRTIEGKGFKNSDDLPKSKTAYNIHRAKREGGTVIVVEASFSVMRVHQAGHPNVIALLGGSLSPFHAAQLNRYFDTIVIMTDWDQRVRKTCAECRGPCRGHKRPGTQLGRKIVEALPNKQILWAAYNDECIYPYQPLEGYRTGPAKDPDDLTDEEINQCLNNAVSNFEFESWEIAETVLPWERQRGIIE